MKETQTSYMSVQRSSDAQPPSLDAAGNVACNCIKAEFNCPEINPSETHTGVVSTTPDATYHSLHRLHCCVSDRTQTTWIGLLGVCWHHLLHVRTVAKSRGLSIKVREDITAYTNKEKDAEKRETRPETRKEEDKTWWQQAPRVQFGQ